MIFCFFVKTRDILGLLWLSSGKPQEASETTEDPDGRWFSFDISGSDYIILEKKSLPTHLQAFENADTAVALQSIISDLQDLGEAWVC